jgi:hypothetical protein
MKPTMAIYLDNWWPRTSDVMLRKGYSSFASVAAGHYTRGLMGYKSPAAVVKLFAAADNGIYDISAGGAAGASVSTITNGDCQHLNISTAGGNYLLVCNGTDTLRYYDGTNWNLLDTATSPINIIGFTAGNSSVVAHMSLHGKRVFFCTNNELAFYYLPVDSIGGAVSKFSLGALCKKGGYLVATSSWSTDGGNGPNNYFIALTSEGEVVIYRGTDPTDATNWSLVGVYELSPPMSRRCFARVGGDLAVLTKAAVWPLSKAIKAGVGDTSVAFSDNIQRAYNDFATNSTYNSMYGWQVTNFTEAQMLLVNIPILSYPTLGIFYSYQFAMNTMTGAWCRFTNMNAECWLSFNGKLYFAYKDQIYQAWNTNADNGAEILAKAKTAFSPLGSGQVKQVTQARPIFTCDSSVKSWLSFDVDYENTIDGGSMSTFLQSLALWDSAKWDQAVWSASNSTVKAWRTAACKPGTVAATRLQVSAKNVNLTWNATQLLVVDGGLM